MKKNTGKTKVILVGHSMGGLAAREYLQGLARFDENSSRISYRDDVAQLITVGTPHNGADIAIIYTEMRKVFEPPIFSEPLQIGRASCRERV